MKNLKKVLALVLVVAMMASFAVTAGAADFTDGSAIVNTEAVDVMSAIGVLDGYADGSFKPEGTLTREQAAKMITYMILGKTEADKLTAIVAPYSDVAADRWSAGAITYCSNAGIIAGVGNGKFNPTGELTGLQFAKMLLVALGYDPAVEKLTGSSWAVNTATLALDTDLDDDVIGSLSLAISRQDAAQMALNTLKADLVEYENKGSSITINDIVISNGASKATAVTTKKDTATIDGTKDAEGTVQFAEKYQENLTLKTTDEEDKLGRPGYKWTYKSNGKTKDVGTYGDAADNVLVLKDKYADMLTAIQKLMDNDDLKYTDGNVKVWLNGEEKATDNKDVTDAAYYGTVAEVYLKDDDSDKIDRVVAYNYTLDKITDVDTDVSTADEKNGVTAYITFDKAGAFDDDEIVGYNADTYVKDAYVAIIEYDNKIIASFIPETVKGSVTTKQTGDKGYVTIDGTKYYAGVNYKAGSFKTDLTDVSTSSADSAKLFLDENNYILGIDTTAAAAAIDDVYYVDVVWSKDSNVAGATVTSYYAQVVSLVNGTKSEIELEKKDHDLVSKNNDLSKTAAAKGETPAEAYNGGYKALSGLLVTISDKKVGDSKKDNNKFNLTEWNNTKFDVSDAAYDTITADLKKTSTRMTLKDNEKAKGDLLIRLNSETKYLLIEKSANNLAVTAVTGGVAFEQASVTDVTVITEDGKTTALYVLINTADATQKTEYSKDVVFVKGDSSESGDGYRSQEVYLPNGSKDTWKVDDGEYDLGRGFYSYGDNADGFVEFDTVDAIKNDKGYVWDEHEGVMVDATIAADALYNDLLTVSFNKVTIEDINVADAIFVDLHSTTADGSYDRSIGTLKRLCDLVDDKKVKEVKLSMNVSKDGAVVIFLTDANAV